MDRADWDWARAGRWGLDSAGMAKPVACAGCGRKIQHSQRMPRAMRTRVMSASQRLERLAFNKLTRAAKTATAAAQVSLCGGVLVKGNSYSLGGILAAMTL